MKNAHACLQQPIALEFADVLNKKKDMKRNRWCWKLKIWRYATLWTVTRCSECGVASNEGHISYVPPFGKLQLNAESAFVVLCRSQGCTLLFLSYHSI